MDFVPYRFAVAAADPLPLRGLGGIRVDCDGGLELLREANLIVVPGWRDLDDTPRAEITEAVRDAVARGARVASICSGAFLLGTLPDCSMAAAPPRTGVTPSGSRGCFPRRRSSRTCSTSTRAA